MRKTLRILTLSSAVMLMSIPAFAATTRCAGSKKSAPVIQYYDSSKCGALARFADFATYADFAKSAPSTGCSGLTTSTAITSGAGTSVISNSGKLNDDFYDHYDSLISSFNASELADAEILVLDGINQLRAQQNLPAVALDDELGQVARLRSLACANERVISGHDLSVYGKAQDTMEMFGFSLPNYISENLWMGSGYKTASTISSTAMKSWANSSGHYQNIMSKSAAKVGIGAISTSKSASGYDVFITTIFTN